MPAHLIDGKAIAARIRAQAAEKAADLRRGGISPCLVAVMIGDDSAAQAYARSQAKDASTIGIEYRLITQNSGVDQKQASDTIRKLNEDPAVHGVMVNLPVPKGLDGFALQQTIAPMKDVEGVNAANLGLLAMGRARWAPCTAAAAFECLISTGVTIAGKRAVVVGRSNIVGKPLAMLLMNAHATVTICHTRTRPLDETTRQGEILIVSAGAAGLIGAEHVSPGAIVIDVGIHRVSVGATGRGDAVRTVGDVRFEEVSAIASYLTPVPGGVGPVTVAMLLSNTVRAASGV